MPPVAHRPVFISRRNAYETFHSITIKVVYIAKYIAVSVCVVILGVIISHMMGHPVFRWGFIPIAGNIIPSLDEHPMPVGVVFFFQDDVDHAINFRNNLFRLHN